MAAPWILGVAYSHNGAACLLRGDAIVVAIAEERLDGRKRARIRHHLDSLAVRYCLDHAGLQLSDLDALVVGHFSRETPPPLSLPDRPMRAPRRYLTVPHHLCHAYGAFATSGWTDAAVLVIDGQGGPIEHLPAEEVTKLRRASVPGMVRESEVASLYLASTSGMSLVEKHTGDWLPAYRRLDGRPPRSLLQFGSLGGIFAAASALIFDDAMEAGKVMGLAPYGEPRIPVDDFFTIDESGAFHYAARVPPRYRDLAPWPANRECFEELAASAQAALEHGVLSLARRARQLTGARRLCYAGGVALNSVANERIVAELGFDDVSIMPAADDSGTAVGAAYYGLHALTGVLRGSRVESDAAGRVYGAVELETALGAVPFIEVQPCADVLDAAVDRLCAGEILGWFQGGSELGPRALGHRSILCDPRRTDGKDVLNARVKHRESFRPFAPAILAEEAPRWFAMPEQFGTSPHMLRVCRFLDSARGRVPVVEHVDGTGRLQTLTASANLPLHRLVERFFARTGCPLITNTSFNLAGEPIVESPEDALWCLLATGLDAVVLGEQIVCKDRAFGSLLELYPTVRARSARVELPIRDGALRLDATDAPAAISLVSQTPYGPTTQRLTDDERKLLQLCDGSRTGRAILEQLDRSADARAFVLTLAHLRRRHLVSFQLPRVVETD